MSFFFSVTSGNSTRRSLEADNLEHLAFISTRVLAKGKGSNVRWWRGCALIGRVLFGSGVFLTKWFRPNPSYAQHWHVKITLNRNASYHPTHFLRYPVQPPKFLFAIEADEPRFLHVYDEFGHFQSMSDPCISSSRRPATADMIDTPPLSLLYSMLPSMVQTRISRLPSLRGSVRGRYTWRISRSRTPPPSYDAVKASMTDVDYLVDDTSEDEATLTPPPPSETKTGIDWKFANQGVNLLTLAVEESSRPNPDIDGRTASFGRQLYVHSLTYLIRGLPADLTPEEKTSIRSSIPEDIIGPICDDGDKQLVPARGNAAPLPPREPSMLHRVLATGIIQLFILFQFVMPYVKLLIKNAYLYERNNHISERILTTSLDTVDTLGRRSVEFGGAVSKLGDGRVGQVLNDLTSWWVQSIAGGIYEGVGEGMVILGARKTSLRMQD